MAVKYTAADREVFLQILARYPIIDSKKMDAYSVEKKKKTWENIVAEFNIAADEQRTVIQLKRFWDKIKRNRKSVPADERWVLADERRELMATCGGLLEPIIELLPNPYVEIKNMDDSDGIILNKNLGVSVKKVVEGQDAGQELISETDTPTTTSTEQVVNEKALPATATPIFATSKRAKKRQHRHLDAIRNARLKLIQREREHIEELHKIRMEEASFAREAARFRMLQEEAKLKQITVRFASLSDSSCF